MPKCLGGLEYVPPENRFTSHETSTIIDSF